ncbi:U5 small nuclear ribonucleoprotein TSSC4 [Heteronotia binoei]|uniref:U5 small nuclear ribonucleoprotein TSSC4 n=1 Tax=Heteronotia binoei TaxID=13085 RepID=UPI002931CBF8|nr:U5 small nuclear ribonucleoprotein TSSC4 [Heteronotia binoei]XP_060117815.1 U5 small nuclear ribonucleoprotein TSSC4 [Heteronotia binoei]XP_060117816.1 U5 small nuclear ribonucleoprotein TSSC4 [Heteronotia binoei]
MGDEGTGEPFLGIVAGGDKDYEGALPSDTVSLSDSDSDDFGFPDEAEVDTVSPEEPLPLDDVRGGSDESGGHLHGPHRSPVQPFHLKGMSSSFSQRSQSIFDCLEGAAKRAVPSLAEDSVVDGRFKRPLPPPSLSNKMLAENVGRQSRQLLSLKSSPAVPDYVAHPERWTKYSLDGVSETSDKANRSIAMEFLEGLKKSREEQSTTSSESYTPSFNQDPSSSGVGRIVFTKPSKAVLDVSERKRPAMEKEEEAEPIDTKQELRGKPQKKSSNQKEDEMVGLDHLDSGVKEVEDEKPLKLEVLGIQKESGTDSAEACEDTAVATVGFHGSKKRNRKHFRLKASPDEKEEDS